MAKVMRFDRCKSIKFNDLGERRIITGQNAMLIQNILQPGFPAFAHSHPHEQIVIIASGRCEMIVGDEVHPMGPGDIIYIPGGVVHDIRIIGDEPVVNYDVFSPIREDYLNQLCQTD